MGNGEVGRQSPSMGPSMKEKKLQRLFEDLRDKLNENLENNEEEKEALQRQLVKVILLVSIISKLACLQTLLISFQRGYPPRVCASATKSLFSVHEKRETFSDWLTHIPFLS